MWESTHKKNGHTMRLFRKKRGRWSRGQKSKSYLHRPGEGEGEKKKEKTKNRAFKINVCQTGSLETRQNPPHVWPGETHDFLAHRRGRYEEEQATRRRPKQSNREQGTNGHVSPNFLTILPSEAKKTSGGETGRDRMPSKTTPLRRADSRARHSCPEGSTAHYKRGKEGRPKKHQETIAEIRVRSFGRTKHDPSGTTRGLGKKSGHDGLEHGVQRRGCKVCSLGVRMTSESAQKSP